MRKKITKIAKKLGNRHNITALGTVVLVAGVSLTLAFVALDFNRYQSTENAKENRHSAYEDELRRLSGISTNLTPAPDPTVNWKTYENSKYHFSVKYPPGWQIPQESLPKKGEGYILKIFFDEKGVSGPESGKGFSVYIYNALKFPDPAGTDNLKRKDESIPLENCAYFDDITLGEKGYPTKEVDVSLDNPCFEETFFYSLTKNGYTYNIVPRQNKNKIVLDAIEEVRMAEIYSEFFDAMSTLDLSESESITQIPKKIIRNAAAPPQVRYTSGSRCPKENDHPGYSKTKGKHMDEDCCPDPDEWPNPRCAYSAKGLSIMKAKPKK